MTDKKEVADLINHLIVNAIFYGKYRAVIDLTNNEKRYIKRQCECFNDLYDNVINLKENLGLDEYMINICANVIIPQLESKELEE
ncbi:MAG: hypothetical protein NC548_34115 [Lachnospiraceae bacterium]|nr:hypothetical protein [Lachnospiraceae bacterium]